MANIQISGLVEDTAPSATDVFAKEDSGGTSTNKTQLQYLTTVPQVQYMHKAATEITISSGTITVTQSAHKLQPESSTSDDLETISGTVDGESGVFFVSDEGTDTITIKHGTGNIDIVGGADLQLSNGAVFWVSDGTTVYISGGGGGLDTVIDVTVSDMACPSGAETLLCNLNNELPENGTYAIDFYFASGKTGLTVGSGTDVYWMVRMSGVIAVSSKHSMYNPAPSATLPLSAAYHHRTIALPDIVLNSNENDGSYGDLCLYIVPPQDINISEITLAFRRLI